MQYWVVLWRCLQSVESVESVDHDQVRKSYPPENDGKSTCHLKRDHPKRQAVFTWLLPGVHSPKLTQPPKIGHPKRKFIFQASAFRGELLVSGRVYPDSLPIQLLLNLQRLHDILHLSTAFKRRAVWGNLISENSPRLAQAQHATEAASAILLGQDIWGKMV